MNLSVSQAIPFRKAIFLAFIFFCIYYPILIYVNLSFQKGELGSFMILSAFVNFALYIALILLIDQIISWTEQHWKSEIFQLGWKSLVLAILVASISLLFSKVLYWAVFGVHELLGNPLFPKNEFSSAGQLDPRIWDTFSRSIHAITLVTAISIFYFLISKRSNLYLQQLLVQTEKMEKENALARFSALKNQVSPHFLFNSLSILSSLVHVDPSLSEKFIDQLSKSYRYILEQKDKDSVSMKTELDFIRSYAFLLKIRFEEKFDLQVQINEDEASIYSIAPLTLQLLVENAVKHNKMSKALPLVVTIKKQGNFLLVENPIQKLENQPISHSTGIGLSNIVNRYRLLTETAVEISQQDQVFRVKIPLLS